jgi:phytoene dehydrogenase-like protein
LVAKSIFEEDWRMASSPDVLIIGGGLAGLCCARTLHEKGVSFQILEASDGFGGRVRTDELDGYLLDRGFQVLLTAYPEAKRVLDYPCLDLKAFGPGVLSWYAGRMNKLIDPWRTPGSWKESLQSDFGTLGDKLRLARLRSRLRNTSIEEVFTGLDRPTKEALEAAHFSGPIIHRFFRPFLGGILLDGELKSSSRMYEFVFKMMAEGEAGVPSRGMRAIPAQIAEKLPAGAVRLNTRVEELHENELKMAGGERAKARAIVVATDGPSAARLIGEVEPASRSVTCFYYAAEEPPVKERMLVFNGDGAGPVNNFAVISNVAPSYAPAGKHLVSITVLGTHKLTEVQLSGFVIAQMKNWFGKVASTWQLLKGYYLTHAQPQQYPGALEPPHRPVRVRPGVYVCGDHRDNGSIQGAMVSGRRAAEAVLADLAR